MASIKREVVEVNEREFSDWEFLLSDFSDKISNSKYNIGELVLFGKSVGCIFGKKYSLHDGLWGYQLDPDDLWVKESDIDGLVEVRKT